MTKVIVIGGGIVGASAAYRLARASVNVTLVDRSDPGQATAAGAGIVAPGLSFKPPAPFYPLAQVVPILGRAPALANLYLATGHGASGLLLGPYSGAAVADLIQGKPLAADLAPFGPGRFRERR